jgi:hypothetical protein
MGPHSDLDKRPSLMEVSRAESHGLIKRGLKTGHLGERQALYG